MVYRGVYLSSLRKCHRRAFPNHELATAFRPQRAIAGNHDRAIEEYGCGDLNFSRAGLTAGVYRRRDGKVCGTARRKAGSVGRSLRRCGASVNLKYDNRKDRYAVDLWLRMGSSWSDVGARCPPDGVFKPAFVCAHGPQLWLRYSIFTYH